MKLSRVEFLTFCFKSNRKITGTSLAIQWLRRHASNVGSMGSIPGRGTETPHTVGGISKKKKRKIIAHNFFLTMSFVVTAYKSLINKRQCSLQLKMPPHLTTDKCRMCHHQMQA